MESTAPSDTTLHLHKASHEYNTPHDTGMPAILAGILIPHTLTTLFLALRTTSRLLTRKWHPSDTLILVAWAASTAIVIIYSIAAYTPDILLAPSELTLQRGRGSVHPYIMRTYLGLVFYQVCLCLTKVSVLAFYLGVFGVKGRRVVWGTIVFVICYGVPLLFMSIFQCHPKDGEFFGREMTCVPFMPLLISSAALHTATDALIIIIAIPALSRARIPYRQKVALSIVLSLGIFVITAALLRLQLSLTRDFGPGSVGVTNTLAFFVMTVLECDVAIICACAPTLRAVLGRVWPGVIGEGRVPLGDGEGDEEVTRVSYRGHPWASETPGRKSESRGRGYGWRTPGGSRGTVESRPVSLGFEEFLLSLSEQPFSRTPKSKKPKSRDVAAERWDRSQESFVLGVNDPRHSSRASPTGPRASPTRLRTADEAGREASDAESPTGLLGREGG